ncbi:MAG: iron-containing alcohol dehydrogenase [Desulfobacterales bacterium]|nr:iron-containing alcohol dehydrogenase [Desulfobacterales bacterium]
MRFEFAAASRIIFGRGVLKEVAPAASKMGGRALLVIGRNAKRSAPLLNALHEVGVKTFAFSVYIEPTIELVLEGARVARENACDLVIGMGGGSVIDAAKAAAALMNNPGDILDYLEVIGRGKALPRPAAPCVAIPTTAGTGAEVTRNSVLTSPEHACKVSLRSPTMLPDLAVVDPELTWSTPPSITAASGLDALTQVLEPYVSARSNPLTDALCLDGMKRAARSLRAAFTNGGDESAREDMALASLFGGLALANSGLGAVHGFAGPMGAMFPVSHGAACGRLLPFVMEANVNALRRKDSRQALARYEKAARVLTGAPDAATEDGIAWVHDLCRVLKIPSLSRFGITVKHFPGLVAGARRASSMKGNPVALTDEELTEILEKAAEST